MLTTPEERLGIAARLWGWIPHAGQREFLCLRLEDGSEPGVLVAACGRRWGKTACLAIDIAVRILTEPELTQLAVAPTVDQAAGLFDEVVSLLEEARDGERAEMVLDEFPHLAGLVWKTSPYPHIRSKRGNAMVFSCRTAGRTGRNLRGKGTTRKQKQFRVVIDEAAFVPDEAVERAIRPMLATVPGGAQLVEISSPYGIRGHFYEAYHKGERREGRYRSVRLPSSQNPMVDESYLAEMKAEMTDRAYRAEILAEFVPSEGAVFDPDEVREAVCDDDYGQNPLFGRRYVAGVDFGRRGDFTVVGIAEVTPSMVRMVHLARWQGLSWGRQIGQVADLLQQWAVCRVEVDRTGVGDSLAESLQAEILVRRLRCELGEFVFTSASKTAVIDAIVIALAQHRLSFPAWPVLLMELAQFEVTAVSQSTGHERMEAARGHDDCVMALALTVHAAAPWRAISPSGRLIGTTAGRRIPSETGKEADFSCGSDYSNDYAERKVPFPTRLQTWLLGRLYRSEGGRRVGAWLRQITR